MQARHVTSVTSVTVDNDVLSKNNNCYRYVILHLELYLKYKINIKNIYILVKANSHIQIVLAEP